MLSWGGYYPIKNYLLRRANMVRAKMKNRRKYTSEVAKPALNKQVFSYTNCNSCNGSSKTVSAPWLCKNSFVFIPQDTEIQGRPAFFAV